MALLEGHTHNFNTLLRAARNGDLALMECRDAVTGEYRAVLCAVFRDLNEAGEEQFNMVPFGHLSNGDPYAEYIPC